MAFKKGPTQASVPDSPEKVLLDLPRRTIPGVLLHQGEMLRSYAARAVGAPDVALELPTGSGKTLVGLLIAEWRRRRSHERVLYLCPTRQLVNQVVEQANDLYGLDVQGFTGSAAAYSPQAKTDYRTAAKVAVTTYSSLFNSNPFFDDPDVVIVDDAHAAENYVAQLWTLRVERFRDRHAAIHAALAAVLRPLLDRSDFTRLTGVWESPADRAWVDKIATPDLLAIKDELTATLDAHVDSMDLRWPWQVLRDHLDACQLYVSSSEILIRPLIPPTWTHAPFAQAGQRIFMSATLGAGGDLERLTGRRDILRLPVPDGWDRQGIGRRFFMFPELSLPEVEMAKLKRDMMRRAGRSVVLVPSDKASESVVADVEQRLGFEVFDAEAIEASKKPFVGKPQAVAVMANRYDGIDFPGDDCRLLFVEGLPRATNLQERFIMGRMGATVLLNERVQTRVLQAIGRCTRALADYSAVVVTGEEVTDYLVDRRKQVHLHPELQAELDFGIEQSREQTVEGFLENLDTFLRQRENKDWEGVNSEIIAKRAAATRQAFPAMNDLGAVVRHEIDFQARLWQRDHTAALEAAERVLGGLNAPELRGYRALWHYLAGSAAQAGAADGMPALAAKARAHFTQAKKAAVGVRWLVGLARFQAEEPAAAERDADDAALLRQIERTEAVLERLGTLHDRSFAAHEREILEGLADSDRFEEAQRRLGELLGFDAGKVEADASPDPWWIASDLCFVFEDHAGAQGPDSILDATKARQAATHPNWMRVNVPAAQEARILPVLVTPARRAKSGAVPHLGNFALWPLDEFHAWAREALVTVRVLRRTFAEPGDLVWRAEAVEAFRGAGLDAPGLFARLSARPASGEMQEVA